MEIARALSLRRAVHHPRRADRAARRRRDRPAVRPDARRCRRQGVTFLFISHHLQEIYEICDTVTVFRDARHILTAPVAELAEHGAGRRDDRRGDGPDRRRGRRAGRRTPTRPVLPSSGLGLTGVYADVSPSTVARRRGRRPGRRRRQRQGRGRRDHRRPAPRRRPGTVEVGGAAAAAGQRARRARRRRRLRPAGPAPRGPRAAAVDRRERHADRAAPARPLRVRRRRRRATRWPREAIDDLAIKAAGPRAAGLRAVRRQPAEGRHGPRAGQRPAGCWC